MNVCIREVLYKYLNQGEKYTKDGLQSRCLVKVEKLAVYFFTPSILIKNRKKLQTLSFNF